MTLRELKQKIKDKQVADDLIIFNCKENSFIADEYTDAIVNLRGGNKQIIRSIYQTQSAPSFLLDDPKTTYVLRADKFIEQAEDYSIFRNVIVICSDIDKIVQEKAKQYIVDVPALKDWQVISYIKAICPGIKNEAEWLYHACNENIFKIKNEIDKLKLFNKSEQRNVLTELKNQQVSDLFKDDKFRFTDALVKKDVATVHEILAHRFCCDVDPIFVLPVIITNLTKICEACFSSSYETSNTAMPRKQYWAVRFAYKDFNLGRLMYCMDEMTSIDLKLKTGRLDFNGDYDRLLDFIVVRMLG